MQMIRIHVDLGSFGLDMDHGSVGSDTIVTAELSVELHEPGLEQNTFEIGLFPAVEAQYVADDRVHTLGLLLGHAHHTLIRGIGLATRPIIARYG
jgi:hypothetical protein